MDTLIEEFVTKNKISGTIKDDKCINENIQLVIEQTLLKQFICDNGMEIKITFTENEREHYTGPFAVNAKFKTPEDEYKWAKSQFKVCTKCTTNLDFTEYGFNTSGKDPFDKSGYRLRRPECKSCNKKVTTGKTEAMKIAKANGQVTKAPEGTACELCKSTDRKIVFDHDHVTNRFRGWLCDNCNRSIGMIGEENILNGTLVKYLTKSV